MRIWVAIASKAERWPWIILRLLVVEKITYRTCNKLVSIVQYIDKNVNGVYTVTDEKVPSHYTVPGNVYGGF